MVHVRDDTKVGSQAFLGGRPGPRLEGALWDVKGRGGACATLFGGTLPFKSPLAGLVPAAGSAAASADGTSADPSSGVAEAGSTGSPLARPFCNCATDVIPAWTYVDCILTVCEAGLQMHPTWQGHAWIVAGPVWEVNIVHARQMHSCIDGHRLLATCPRRCFQVESSTWTAARCYKWSVHGHA